MKPVAMPYAPRSEPFCLGELAIVPAYHSEAAPK